MIRIITSFLTLSLLALSSAALSSNAMAQEATSPHTVSANVALTTDYVFRGISQSNEEAAIQGGMDYAHESGLYLGVWGSSVDLPDAQTELDFYAGINGSIDKLVWDVGALYYYYPGNDSEYDFWEAAFALGYDFDIFSVSLGLNYSPEFYADTGDAWYYAAYLDVPLPYDFSLAAHIGRQTIDDNTTFGSPDYTDWAIGLGYSWEGFDLGLTYTDTDLDEPGECADGCAERVVFNVSRSF